MLLFIPFPPLDWGAECQWLAADATVLIHVIKNGRFVKTAVFLFKL